MCLEPSEMWIPTREGGRTIKRTCGQCWQCRRKRVNDFVGRSLCEAHHSEVACFVTLTYAPRDDGAEKEIRIEHFQRFIKRLRKRGHKVRYMVAGEYGSLKGRTHFHALLFFDSMVREKEAKIPKYEGLRRYAGLSVTRSWGWLSDKAPERENIHIREWPHGHVYFEWGVAGKQAGYVAKYCMKEGAEGETQQAWFSYSKVPALGYRWFAERAAEYRAKGVMPSQLEYSPPGGDPKTRYYMRGAILRDFLNSISMDCDVARLSKYVRPQYLKLQRQREAEAEWPQPREEYIQRAIALGRYAPWRYCWRTPQDEWSAANDAEYTEKQEMAFRVWRKMQFRAMYKEWEAWSAEQGKTEHEKDVEAAAKRARDQAREIEDDQRGERAAIVAESCDAIAREEGFQDARAKYLYGFAASGSGIGLAQRASAINRGRSKSLGQGHARFVQSKYSISESCREEQAESGTRLRASKAALEYV